MHLFDPQRPTLPNGKPCWLRGHIAVGQLQVWPLENDQVRVSIMLPLAVVEFVSRWYSITIHKDTLPSTISAFTNDPEGWCESTFAKEGIGTALRISPAVKPAPVTPRRLNQPIREFGELEITF